MAEGSFGEEQGAMESENWMDKICSDLTSHTIVLTELDVDGERNTFHDDDLSLLSRSLRKCKYLSRLGFSRVRFSSLGLLELVTVLKNMTCLKELMFDAIEDAYSCLPEMLSVALFYNKSIESLVLISCWDESPIPAYSIKSLMNSAFFLTELHLSHNQIDPQAAAALASSLKQNKKLKTLDLTDSSMNCEAIRILCTGLVMNQTLETLILDFNAFGDEGVSNLSEMLTKNNWITELHLFGNNVSPIGASSLAKALTSNTKLDSLILSFNQIGDSGTAALAEALTINNSLKALWLPSNMVTLAGMQAFAYHLPKMKGLQHLHVGLVLDDLAVESLAVALQQNFSLEVLHLEQPGLSEEHDEITDSSCRIDFFLRLNQSGRRHLHNNKLHPGLWSRVLARGANSTSLNGAPDVLHFLLREHPEFLGHRVSYLSSLP